MPMRWTIRGQFFAVAWIAIGLLLARLGLGVWGMAVVVASGVAAIPGYPSIGRSVLLGAASGFVAGLACISLFISQPLLAPPIVPFPGAQIN